MRHISLVVLALTSLASCGEGNYLFTGRAYDSATKCFGPTVALDVLSGDEPATCAPRCVRRILDGGTSLFASDVCGPIPVGFTEVKDPACDESLPKFKAGCQKDAGGAGDGG